MKTSTGQENLRHADVDNLVVSGWEVMCVCTSHNPTSILPILAKKTEVPLPSFSKRLS